LLLSGKLIEAETAKRFGMINEVIAKETIRKEVTDFALKLCAEASAQSLSLTKDMIAHVQDVPLDYALKYAAKNEC